MSMTCGDCHFFKRVNPLKQQDQPQSLPTGECYGAPPVCNSFPTQNPFSREIVPLTIVPIPQVLASRQACWIGLQYGNIIIDA